MAINEETENSQRDSVWMEESRKRARKTCGQGRQNPLLPLFCYRPFLSHSFFLPLSHFPMVSNVSISFPISHSIFRPFSFLCALFLSALFSSPSLLLSRFLIFLPLCFSSISPSSTSLLFSTCFALVHSIRMRINLRKKAFWGQSFASCRRGRRHATSSK